MKLIDKTEAISIIDSQDRAWKAYGYMILPRTSIGSKNIIATEDSERRIVSGCNYVVVVPTRLIYARLVLVSVFLVISILHEINKSHLNYFFPFTLLSYSKMLLRVRVRSGMSLFYLLAPVDLSFM